MVLLQNTAEGQAAGTTLTVGNSGGGSGDAFSSISGTSTFQNVPDARANGSLRCYRTDSASAYGQWTGLSWAQASLRAYVYLTANPSTAGIILNCDRNGGSNGSRLVFNTSGRLSIRNASDATLATSPNPVPLNTWVRLELQVDQGTSTTTGTITFSYYLGDSPTPIWTSTTTNTNAGFGTALGNFRCGRFSGTFASMYWDDFAAQDSFVAIGPVVPSGSYVRASSGLSGYGYLTVQAPYYTVDGDQMLAFHNSDDATPSASTAFTDVIDVGDSPVDSNTGAPTRTQTYKKTASSEPTSYGFQINPVDGGDTAAGVMSVANGSIRQIAVATGTSSTPTAPSVTSIDGGVLICAYYIRTDGTPRQLTAPAGMSKNIDGNGDWITLAVTSQLLSGAAATGDKVASFPISRPWRAVSIVVAAAPATTPVQTSTSDSYSVRSVVYDPPASDAYNVRSVVYDPPASDSYRVRSAVSLTRAESYRVRSVVYDPPASDSYRVRAAVAVSRSAAWNVRTAVFDPPVADSYAIRQGVRVDRASTWGVLSGPIITRGNTWSVRAATSIARSPSWAVRSGVSLTRAPSWTVRSAVSLTRAPSWAVRSGVSLTRVPTWNVRAAVALARTPNWNVRFAAALARTTTWTVRQVVQSDSQTFWGVGIQVPPTWRRGYVDVISLDGAVDLVTLDGSVFIVDAPGGAVVIPDLATVAALTNDAIVSVDASGLAIVTVLDAGLATVLVQTD